jgi:hypothetical protein
MTADNPDDLRPPRIDSKPLRLTAFPFRAISGCAQTPGGCTLIATQPVCGRLRGIALARGANTPADPQIGRQGAAEACCVENKKAMPNAAPGPSASLELQLGCGGAGRYSSSSFFGLYWAMMFCTSFDGTLS